LEELHNTLRLMGPADKLVVSLIGNHHNPFLALPSDELGTFGSRTPEYLAKPGFCRLNLPRRSNGLQAASLPRAATLIVFPRSLAHGFSLIFPMTSLTRHMIAFFVGFVKRGSASRRNH
jgi:hypothetical protein